jgi:hypothetical protein
MEKFIKRYVPEKVLFFIQQSDYLRKEDLYIICDMLYRVNNYNKNDNYNGYVEISQQYFRDIITAKEFITSGKNFLIENKIILCDNISIKGEKSYGYKFSDNFVSKIKEVKIFSKTYGKRIIKNKNTRNNIVNNSYKRYKEYFINNFNIDYDKAFLWIEENYDKKQEEINTSLCREFLTKQKMFLENIHRYNHYLISINSIRDKDLFFRVGKSNGRVDTNLTNLKSDLRQFISIDNLVQIDISNSQPYFLGNLIQSKLNNQEEINTSLCREFLEYKKMTENGSFYKEFGKIYFNKTSKSINKKEIKNIMFKIFYSQNKHFIKEKNIFKSVFPNVLKFIEDMKIIKHNRVALDLQKMESDFCILDVCINELDKLNINYLTIHDSWLVSVDDLEKVKKIIKDKFMEKFNNKPTLKIDDINSGLSIEILNRDLEIENKIEKDIDEDDWFSNWEPKKLSIQKGPEDEDFGDWDGIEGFIETLDI